MNSPESLVLSVPLFSQADNASFDDDREGLASSCAMLAAFYGLVSTNDSYARRRSCFGGARFPDGDVQTLESLGLSAVFHRDWGAGMLIRELQLGRPVAVAWFQGDIPTAPRGGCHWSVVTGAVPLGFVMNDPMGEVDLVRGGYVSRERGFAGVYSSRYWLPRWDVGSRVHAHGSYSGYGWAITAKPRANR
jgi:hypothetical protein